MNDILNHTTLQPLLFDFRDFSLSNNMPLSKKEAEFASYWNSIASMLPDSMFETNRMGRKGYRDADVLAVRIVMLFFKQNNIKQALSFLETSMGGENGRGYGECTKRVRGEQKVKGAGEDT